MKDLAAAWAEVPSFSTIRASGDGLWAFWTCSGLTETDDLWVCSTDGRTAPERLTFGQDHYFIRDVNHDGSLVLLAQSTHASEHDHLVLLHRPTGALRQLTPTQSDHYVFGGRFLGDAVLFAADYDYATQKVVQGGWIWRMDLATGALTCLATSDRPFGTGPIPSPDGRNILWLRHMTKPGATQAWVMAADGSALREVLRVNDVTDLRADWLDDDRIAFVADDGGDRLGVLTLSRGAVEWLAGEPDFCPHDVLPGAGALACIHHVKGRTETRLFPGGDLPNRSGRRSLLPHDALPDGGWLAEAYDASAPHEIVRILPNGEVLRLFSPASDVHHIAPEEVFWTGEDGMPMQGWLYRPEGEPKGLIAYVHGGPTWHSEDWVNPKIGFWVQEGYAVLDPNYRGSTGFGRDHREAVKVDGWGGREQTDIRRGVESLRLGVKVGIAGNSYGGFSSWTGITRHPDLYAGAIPMCGMYRLEIDYHATEMPWGKAYSEEMMGGSPEELPEKYDNASPGKFIHQIKGRLMVVHGLADSNVGPENSHAAHRELTAAGIAHEMVLYPDEGHGVFRRTNVADYLRRSAAFWAAALG